MLLEVTELHKRFGQNEILKGVSLKVDEGEVIGIIGPSGSGKSTFLRCIDFLERPDAGHIRLDGRSFDVYKASKGDIQYMRSNTAMVFQQFNLFRYKTALENVMEGPVTVHHRDREETRRIALEHLASVGLLERVHYFPRQLSGGQQQRVAIARALALEPKVMLLDEPTSALDPEMVGEVLAVIRTMAERGKTMIIVSHEMDFIRQISNRVLFLDDGRIAEEGTAAEIFTCPKTDRLKEFLRRLNCISDYAI